MNRKTPLITAGLAILFIAALSAGLYTYTTYSRMKIYVSAELREVAGYTNKLMLDLRSLNLLSERYIASPTPENLYPVSETIDLVYFRTDLIASVCGRTDFPLDLSSECRGLYDIYREVELSLSGSNPAPEALLPEIRRLMDEAETIGMIMIQKADLLDFQQVKRSGDLLSLAGRRILIFLSALTVALFIIAVLSFRQIKISGQLHSSELKFKSVFNEAFEFFALVDVRGRILDVNNAALKIAGIKKDAAIGILFSEGPWWNHSADLQADVCSAIDTAVSGQTVRMNVLHIDPEGVPVHVDFSLKPVLDEAGSVVLLIAEGRDITTIIEAESELTRLRNYLENMIDSMSSAIIGVDEDCRITQWNRTAIEITGIDARSAIGVLVAELVPGTGSCMELITGSIESGIPGCELKRASVFGHQDRIENIFVFPLRGDDERGAVLRIDDITETVAMQEKIIQGEKMLSVGGLAAGLAHEINNPLAGMMQTAEVLYDRLSAGDIPANARAAEKAGLSLDSIRAYMEERNILELLEGIRASGLRAAGIVGNMLSFARKSDASKTPNDIGLLMNKSLELAAADYNLKKQYNFDKIRITKEIAPGLPLVVCEAQKIQQVFLNILKNGAQAMSEAGRLRRESPGKYIPEFRISIHSGSDKNTGSPSGVRIEIADNGTGMGEDVRRRIFEPFFTTKTVGEGTGLGLSVSYFIITENHSGTFSVESSEGEGTRFIISLP